VGVNLMGKLQSQPQKQQSQKLCFGTKEWSENSGICRGCEFKESCGKAKANRE
jgi:hypothetical protein